jgi:hypothetical protein
MIQSPIRPVDSYSAGQKLILFQGIQRFTNSSHNPAIESYSEPVESSLYHDSVFLYARPILKFNNAFFIACITTTVAPYILHNIKLQLTLRKVY